MPKMKTKKSLRLRVKVTGTGKLMRFESKRRPLLSHKSGKKLRQLRGAFEITNATAKTYKQLLSPGL